MVIRVGINGFGRIGRITFRTCFQNSEIQLAAINDPAIDIEYICYLIKFDSTHGKFKENVTHTDDEITINDHKIKVFQEKLPPNVPWHRAGVHYVIEASGMFTCMDKASGHLASEGVRRVIVTAPSVDVPMVILGVNDYLLTADHKVISCTSSTLYCLAPIIKVLNDHFGVVEGFITSIHAMTPSLKPLDGLCLRGKHWRDHRSINQNIIPAATGACKALGKIIPPVKDKMTGLAFRVPIVNVSVLDITIKLDTNTSKEDIVRSVEKASRQELKNIIRISNEDAVSSDFIGESHSCILDVDSSLELRPNFYKIICWYENEYSYACRVVDVIFYSEMQFAQAHSLASKATYVRAKLPHHTQMAKRNFNKTITIQYNYANPPTDDIFYKSSNENIKTKICVKPRPLVARKPFSSQSSGTATSMYNRDSKKENEVFKIWNERCNSLPKKSVRQTNNSFLHSCITFDREYRQQKAGCVKDQNRLENVKRKFSKVLIITEDLLKKSRSSESKLQCLESPHITDVSTSTAVRVEPLEDVSNNYKKSYTNMDVSEATIKDGDFKDKNIINCTMESKNNEANTHGHHVTDYMTEFTRVEDKPNVYGGTRKTKVLEKLTLKELHEQKRTTKYTKPLNNDDTLNIISINSEPAEQLNKNENSARNDTASNINSVGKSINSLTCAIGNQLVENLLNELHASVAFKPNKSLENDRLRHKCLNIDSKVCLNIEDNALRMKDKDSTQNFENIVSNNLESPERYSSKDLRRYLKNNTLNMYIFDEELKKRNLVLTSSDSNNVLDILGDFPTIEKTACCKHVDSNRKNIGSIRLVAETGPVASPCGSSGHTVTTVSNGDRSRVKDDLYDKLDSASASDSDNSFQINERKSQVININDLTNSLEDLARLDKICRIIEISDELSDQLFSNLDNSDATLKHGNKWSFKELCDKIKLDEFCNNVFGRTSF